MNLEISRYKLYASLQALEAVWEQVQRRWRDPVRQEFEEQFWQRLEPAVRQTLAAMDRLAQVLQQMRQECE